MVVQRSTKITTLTPSVRTLADSKLGVDLYRESASWNSIGVPSSKTPKTPTPRNLPSRLLLGVVGGYKESKL
ncbi:hypothetical protein BHM03_00061854 [Ensete ventricosum]|nr:hypothetical protein BHM03_00061854 [Ensete ventricosum]